MSETAAPGKIGTVSDRRNNRQWLREQMNPFFFIAMQDEPDALALLERELGIMRQSRRMILADREKSLILALVNQRGTLYDTLRRLREREISYAMIAHSTGAMPGMKESLEIQRFEFDRKSNEEILDGGDAQLPPRLRRRIAREVHSLYPDFNMKDFDHLLHLLWLNNQSYVSVSPPRRVAQALRLFQQGNKRGGLFLDVETMESGEEFRILFAVGNPPQKEFLLQVMEVFNRLHMGVNRAYCLTISNGIHPYFLGTFYVTPHVGGAMGKGSEIFSRLKHELANTQILDTDSYPYREFVVTAMMTGEDASLLNAFISFCHTNLAHNQPDRFGLDDVRSAFYSHPEIALQLVQLFRTRFDPAGADRVALFSRVLTETERTVAEYNTGHRYLDQVRRTIFHCAVLFIRYTLKTNFFVLEKQALAFRIDPRYLSEMGQEFTADLPQTSPFRITFFFSRFGCGYHIGFSDIARGGWRTVIARDSDDFVTNANTLFRENYVLAHTQHLKNKDIYEGGSKLVVILDASDLRGRAPEHENWRLYKLQYGVINSFLDIFVTKDGVALNPQVVDYYREDEPIELGPDENMHDAMVEAIAWLSKQRGYLLGIGIISSKRVGINHKQYGVTSTGVVAFAEITMAELGIDTSKDSYSVKFTGGPNGDVAGNAMRIMLERSPQVQIRLILDGTAVLCDMDGADHGELRRILLKEDLHAFNPAALHPGGFLLFRTGSRTEGLRELFRKVTRSDAGLLEEWVSVDEFHREYNSLVFRVAADLFIPAGGRPETIYQGNWQHFLLPDGTPSARAIVEGANSFFTPEARVELQGKGVIIMRDASANKCGVISSSYEVIANLLLSEDEFMTVKERYVQDVLTILEKRAVDEARLILKRHQAQPELLCTEISDAISSEINANYSRLYEYFRSRPELCLQPLFRRAVLAHLPRMLRESPGYRRRLGQLPPKYLPAMLAAEIGSSLIYNGNLDADFEDILRLHVRRNFPEQ